MIQRSICKICKSYPFFSLNLNKQFYQTESPVRKTRYNNQNRKIFKKHQGNTTQRKSQFKQTQMTYQQSNIAQQVQKINQVNRYFLGITQNTAYFKVYNQKKYQDCLRPSVTKYQINDVPFKFLKEKSQSDKSQLTLKNNKATNLVFSWTSQEKLTKQMKKLVQSYFSDLVKKQRNCRIQPNFEWESHKIMQTLKANSVSFNIKDQRDPSIFIQNILLLKGVKVNRNDNYTLDSYQVNFDEQNQGITKYTLWKREKEQYPQQQWFAARYMVARIQALVTNAPLVQVSQAGNIVGSTEHSNHKFLFQVDLTVPPSLAQFSLSSEQYQKSYRLNLNKLQITNVDSKNSYFQIAYSQMQKKQKLINKLV